MKKIVIWMFTCSNLLSIESQIENSDSIKIVYEQNQSFVNQNGKDDEESLLHVFRNFYNLPKNNYIGEFVRFSFDDLSLIFKACSEKNLFNQNQMINFITFLFFKNIDEMKNLQEIFGIVDIDNKTFNIGFLSQYLITFFKKNNINIDEGYGDNIFNKIKKTLIKGGYVELIKDYNLKKNNIKNLNTSLIELKNYCNEKSEIKKELNYFFALEQKNFQRKKNNINESTKEKLSKVDQEQLNAFRLKYYEFYSVINNFYIYINKIKKDILEKIYDSFNPHRKQIRKNIDNLVDNEYSKFYCEDFIQHIEKTPQEIHEKENYSFLIILLKDYQKLIEQNSKSIYSINNYIYMDDYILNLQKLEIIGINQYINYLKKTNPNINPEQIFTKNNFLTDIQQIEANNIDIIDKNLNFMKYFSLIILSKDRNLEPIYNLLRKLIKSFHNVLNPKEKLDLRESISPLVNRCINKFKWDPYLKTINQEDDERIKQQKKGFLQEKFNECTNVFSKTLEELQENIETKKKEILSLQENLNLIKNQLTVIEFSPSKHGQEQRFNGEYPNFFQISEYFNMGELIKVIKFHPLLNELNKKSVNELSKTKLKKTKKDMAAVDFDSVIKEGSIINIKNQDLMDLNLIKKQDFDDFKKPKHRPKKNNKIMLKIPLEDSENSSLDKIEQERRARLEERKKEESEKAQKKREDQKKENQEKKYRKEEEIQKKNKKEKRKKNEEIFNKQEQEAIIQRQNKKKEGEIQRQKEINLIIQQEAALKLRIKSEESLQEQQEYEKKEKEKNEQKEKENEIKKPIEKYLHKLTQESQEQSKVSLIVEEKEGEKLLIEKDILKEDILKVLNKEEMESEKSKDLKKEKEIEEKLQKLKIEKEQNIEKIEKQQEILRTITKKIINLKIERIKEENAIEKERSEIKDQKSILKKEQRLKKQKIKEAKKEEKKLINQVLNLEQILVKKKQEEFNQKNEEIEKHYGEELEKKYQEDEEKLEELKQKHRKTQEILLALEKEEIENNQKIGEQKNLLKEKEKKIHELRSKEEKEKNELEQEKIEIKNKKNILIKEEIKIKDEIQEKKDTLKELIQQQLEIQEKLNRQKKDQQHEDLINQIQKQEDEIKKQKNLLDILFNRKELLQVSSNRILGFPFMGLDKSFNGNLNPFPNGTPIFPSTLTPITQFNYINDNKYSDFPGNLNPFHNSMNQSTNSSYINGHQNSQFPRRLHGNFNPFNKNSMVRQSNNSNYISTVNQNSEFPMGLNLFQNKALTQIQNPPKNNNYIPMKGTPKVHGYESKPSIPKEEPIPLGSMSSETIRNLLLVNDNKVNGNPIKLHQYQPNNKYQKKDNIQNR
jgi:hypothetical protein